MPNIGSGPGGEALGIVGDVGSQFGFPQLTNILGGVTRGNLYNQLTTQQPFSKAAQDQVAQQVYSQLAARGTTQGGVANEAVAQAFSQEDLLRQSLYLQQLQSAIGLIPGASPSGGIPGQFGSAMPGMAALMQMLGMGGGNSGGGDMGAAGGMQMTANPGDASLPFLGA